MSGKKSKDKGTRRELQTIRYLEDRGFACTRAAGSMGVWDVIADRRDFTLRIQVKSNHWPGPAERGIGTALLDREKVTT